MVHLCSGLSHVQQGFFFSLCHTCISLRPRFIRSHFTDRHVYSRTSPWTKLPQTDRKTRHKFSRKEYLRLLLARILVGYSNTCSILKSNDQLYSMKLNSPYFVSCIIYLGNLFGNHEKTVFCFKQVNVNLILIYDVQERPILLKNNIFKEIKRIDLSYEIFWMTHLFLVFQRVKLSVLFW